MPDEPVDIEPNRPDTRPQFAKVTDAKGEHWTGVQDNKGQWRYVVDRDGNVAPYPLPTKASVTWRTGGLIGEPREEMPDPLMVYTIYLNPADVERPDGEDLYVMRLWKVDSEVNPTGEMWTAKSLEEIRELVPWTCVRFPREPNDQPHILESWF